MRLRDKTVIVTGASSGIGRETAIAFAHADANLVLASRNEQALNALAAELAPLGRRILVIPTDVSQRATVEAMVQRAAAEMGGVDILVNNAGLGLNALLAEGSMTNIRRLFEVNVFGALHCIQAVVPYMRKQGSGQIINVSSVAGKIATPRHGAYAATKFALTAISDALRLELADYGIIVITVYPGVTDTPFGENVLKEVEVPPVPAIVRGVPARRVASAIVRAARWQKREVYVTVTDRMAVSLKNLSPCMVDWGMRTFYLRRAKGWPAEEGRHNSKDSSLRLG
jgi:short-subunit dehydrogenase